MRKATITVGLFLCAFAILGGSPANATSANQPKSTEKPLYFNAFAYDALTTDAIDKPEVPQSEEKLAPAEPQPIVYTVVEGETLTIVAEKYASTWMRLFAKNTQIADPNIITVGEQITIPSASEQLADRPLPAAPPPTASSSDSPGSSSNQNYTPASNYYGSANSAGNTYFAGNCTWYAKSRRPDLPNSLGNADEWAGKAQTQGIATGSTPRVGAIGQQGMHVVYVESVNPDGTVTISEMNYQGPYITSSRTVSAGSFVYIY